MGVFEILSIIMAVVGVGASIGSTIATNTANSVSVDKTNAANLQAVRETNAANVEQANLAYQRSLPLQQISDMQKAGISKSAAIAKLTGGGVYTAPTLQVGQSMAKQFDYSKIGDVFERLGDIPANVQQRKMVNEQMNQLRTELNIKKEEHAMQLKLMQEQLTEKQLDNIEKQYGQNVRRAFDSACSKLVSVAREKGVNIADIRTERDIVKLIGDTEEYNNVPELVRSKLAEVARNRFDSYVAEKTENRAVISAKDAHDIAMKHKKQIQQQIDDFNDAKDARIKEYKLRSLDAELRSLATECGLSDLEYKTSLIYIRDVQTGKLKVNHLSAGYLNISDGFDAFWNGLFKIIPLKALSKALIGNLISLSPPK